MNLKKCDSGHYYDVDKFDKCPHCNGANDSTNVNSRFNSGRQLSY